MFLKKECITRRLVVGFFVGGRELILGREGFSEGVADGLQTDGLRLAQ